jgi:hypothetical protein
MTQQILHSNGARCRRQIDLRRTGPLHRYLHLRKGGNVFLYRVAEQQLTLLDEDHCRDRGNRFAHRVDTKDCVLGHRRLRRRVKPPERLEIDNLAVAHDQEGAAGEHAFGDIGVERLGDPLKPFVREANIFWLARVAERLRP